MEVYLAHLSSLVAVIAICIIFTSHLGRRDKHLSNCIDVLGEVVGQASAELHRTRQTVAHNSDCLNRVARTLARSAGEDRDAD